MSEWANSPTLWVKQRKQLDERNGLIAEMQALPGFKKLFDDGTIFDTTPLCCCMRTSYHYKPFRVALVRTFSSVSMTPSLPLSRRPTNFYGRAIGLRSRLVNNIRKQHRIEAKQYQHTLRYRRYVLRSLCELVGRR
jgi:hypothetical protein